MVTDRQFIAIRRVGEDDRAALERLAALDSQPVPSGWALIAQLQSLVPIGLGGTR